MAKEGPEKFRVLVMDDYEGVAEGVPLFEKLKARADVAVMRKRLETDEEMKRVLKDVHAIVLVRGRSRFGEKEFFLSPLLRLVSQIGHGIDHRKHQDLHPPGALSQGLESVPTVKQGVPLLC